MDILSLLEELEEALIMSDVGMETSEKIIAHVLLQHS